MCLGAVSRLVWGLQTELRSSRRAADALHPESVFSPPCICGFLQLLSNNQCQWLPMANQTQSFTSEWFRGCHRCPPLLILFIFPEDSNLHSVLILYGSEVGHAKAFHGFFKNSRKCLAQITYDFMPNLEKGLDVPGVTGTYIILKSQMNFI